MSRSDGDCKEGAFFEESDYDYESASDDEYLYPEEDLVQNHSMVEASLFNQDPVSCPICCEERVEEGFALTLPSCSHSFCIECFTQYIEVEIGQGNADSITCPHILENNGSGDSVGNMNVIQKCNASVGMEVLHEIMTREKYERLIGLKDSAFVLKNTDYHHCPTPDCGNIVLCKPIVDGDGNLDKDDGDMQTDKVPASTARICDCFKCGRTSCLTCRASPYHTGRTCKERREEQRMKEFQEERARRRLLERQRQHMHIIHGGRTTTVDRSRANEEAKYELNIGQGEGDVGNEDSDAFLNVKRCRRCGNGIELSRGCLKMKCICGYRFCYRCGAENAQCDCTPAYHGFTDNRTGSGDFSGLNEMKSYT
mmetsp:Transcript_24477/g.41914  ORF Transcript_24477/g.41914 Transcript_24477/m.41914 type:complete len:368 (-) Transcript_24477:128-1231(-)|eukprot:CAMPEP_0183724638 /NCGR_PEP_ID=MMETSP0737-20130205/18055_1 /TAXON_ID=385413 /ORGANISM="Thalassiosira miniscula, Strain CCMP1093" /LENGTH=367 /DNA_ID=CAMNT_0025955277 /DNA_START=451 /DNA_END=1554 /DNA_ORIENTATION=-